MKSLIFHFFDRQKFLPRIFRVFAHPVKSSKDFVRLLRRMPEPYRNRFGISVRTWLLYHQKDILFDQCMWMGVQAMKNPLDAWIYQEIIYECKSDVIIEIGSASGGSTLFLAHVLGLINPSGFVISIDIDRASYDVSHERIIVLTGDSASTEMVDAVRRYCAGKRVLVIHDGDHRAAQVFRDMEAYAPLVSIGSYFIVEDGIMDLFRPGDGIGSLEAGPLVAIERFLQGNANFTVDSLRERYIATSNPKGFLKRIS